MASKKRPLSIGKEVTEILVALGIVLSHDRKRLGLTVEEVARRARIEPERLDAIEAGTDEELDFLLIVRLASALKTDTDAVLKAVELRIRKIRDKAHKGGIAKKPCKRAPRSGAGTRRRGR